MKWYSNWKVSKRLISGFVIVALIAGLVGAIGIVELKSAESSYSTLYSSYRGDVSYLTSVNDAFQLSRVTLRNMMLDKDPNNMQKYMDDYNGYVTIVDDNLAKYAATVTDPKERDTFNDLKSAWEILKPINQQEMNLVSTGHPDQAFAVSVDKGSEITKSISDTIDNLTNVDLNTISKEFENMSQNNNRTALLLIVIVVVCMLVAIGLGWFISGTITGPIKGLLADAERIADGNLAFDIQVYTKDEFGKLFATFKRMVENLNEVMANIDTAAEQVAAGSRQVAQSSMALSQGSTEQASSVQELTASIEEISSQTNLNAQNANQANELAETAKQDALQGNSRMQEMLKAMEEINDASGNISKIIKVIDEIAFQTNILALNAAVEAARAGQHGKGFAVVAEEVRNLAARSANAAKETTSMIEGSIKKVDDGTRIANATAQALNEIVARITKVSNLASDIAVASNEQATGIAQITQGISQVSQVVQTDTATSQETAASSEELSGQAELLKEQISKFKIRKSDYAPAKGLEDLNPEVLRMLENMSEKRHNDVRLPLEDAFAEAAAAGSEQIDLSDQEFGKY